MLGTSLSESETEDQSSSSNSESEFDLSDPNAGIATDDDLFGSQLAEVNSSAQFSSQDVYVLANDRDVSPSDNDASDRNFTSVSIPHRGQRGRRPKERSRQTGRARSIDRGRCRERGSRGIRSRGRRSRSHRYRGRFRDRQQEERRDPLPKISITTRADVARGTFQFSPSQPPGLYIPSEVDTSNPEAIFKLFFDKQIVEYICKCSNEYAELNKDKKAVMYSYYNNMCTEDFYKMVAILIHLGYKKIPRYRLAWKSSSLCYDQFISKVLSRNKFESIMTFLHVVDKDKESQLRDDKDKILKVRPLFDHINSRCQKFCQPSEEISIDERMVRSKARFSFKQYIKNKPTKWGFKLWCLCNSSDGYTIKFSIYRGKTGELSSGKGLSYDVVMRLMDDYLDEGYNLFVDNFYTSPTLATDLFARSTYITGTLDRTRVGVPPEVSDCYRDLSSTKRSRGEGLYVREGCIVYSTWKDTKCLTILSTKYPGHSESTVKRNTKDAEGHHQTCDVPIPLPVYHYNKHMGGVDKSDQLIHYYNVLRSTHKYWKTLFFHFIDIAVVNSYIIHIDKERNPLSHFGFRENLVRSLSGIILESPRHTSQNEAVHGILQKRTTGCSLLDHYPQPISRSQCIYCKITDNGIHTTTRQCKTCQVPLCFMERDCFLKWHKPSFQSIRKKCRKKYLKSLTTTSPSKRGRPQGSTVTKGKGKRKKKGW